MDVDQPALPGLARRPARKRAPVAIAESDPIARVLVDRPQPHLDRAFDYWVPATMSDTLRAGVRVKVRFAGSDVDAWVIERCARSDHDGQLVPVRRLVSDEVVLVPEVLSLCRAVAHRWGGTVADVLRLAVPPRHARVESEEWFGNGEVPTSSVRVGGLAEASRPDQSSSWATHPGGGAFLRRIAEGQGPWAVWQPLPWTCGPRWTDQVADAVVAARSSGRGALVVAATAAQVELIDEALEARGIEQWTPGAQAGRVRLMADDGPASRYRTFLAVSRGAADVVVGTRSAAFAPLHDPGLLVCWDDSSSLHSEPRAPYPHARDVLALRAEQTGAALLVGGYTRSTASQRWLGTGRAHALVADRSQVRAGVARAVHLDHVELAREGPAAAARLPSAAWRMIRDGLSRGPVLVQVPRSGYLPGVACARCRASARCAKCAGPLQLTAGRAIASCRWCGALAHDWRCSECGHGGLRSTSVGAGRTAEELARAFPGVRLRRSSAEHGVLATVGTVPELVVSTPGAEPVAEDGYAAAVLLDAAVLAGRPGLGADEAALRHWLGAAALVRPGAQGGVVGLVGDVPSALAGAFVRWDPAGFAERLLAERAELGLPPAAHMVVLEGERAAVGAVAAEVTEVAHGVVTLRGPVPTGPAPVGVLDPEQVRPVRVLLQTPWDRSGVVLDALRSTIVARSAGREPGVRVVVEPQDLEL